jgi:hypothetical protein
MQNFVMYHVPKQPACVKLISSKSVSRLRFRSYLYTYTIFPRLIVHLLYTSYKLTLYAFHFCSLKLSVTHGWWSEEYYFSRS